MDYTEGLYKNRVRSKEFSEELKNMGFNVVRLAHALRVNGCVDIWFNSRTVYIKPENEYMNFDSKREERIMFALNKAVELGRQDPFKKTSKGNMTYQEFKHRMNGGLT